MASKNQSNNEKTIKSSLISMPNDFWTIDNISLYCNYLNAAILPDGFILDDYRDYFENFLVEIDVPEEYYYSPSLFSEIQYGTPDLDFLVMYFAGMTSLFEFNEPRIKFLPVTSLSDLNKLIVQRRNEIRQSKASPTLYTELASITLPPNGYIGTDIIETTIDKKRPPSRNIGSVSFTAPTNSSIGKPSLTPINQVDSIKSLSSIEDIVNLGGNGYALPEPPKEYTSTTTTKTVATQTQQVKSTPTRTTSGGGGIRSLESIY